MRRVSQDSLIAVVADRLVCARDDTEIGVQLERPPANAEELIRLFDEGIDAPSLGRAAQIPTASATELLDTLTEHGLITAADRPRPGRGVPLVAAIVAARNGGGSQPTLIWTAAELLALPPSLPTRVFRRAVRVFVGGLADPVRLEAYAHAATAGARTVCGDDPRGYNLRTAVEQLDPAAIHVVDLATDAVSSVDVAGLCGLDGHAPHRLGPLLWLRRIPAQRPTWTARYALPNLRFHDRRSPRLAYGSGASAELIARAEAIERYAAGDLAGRHVVRARARDLDGAVEPTDLVALSARQYRDHPDADPYSQDEEYLWTPAYGPRGRRRWVPAASAFVPFFDPRRERQLPGSTSSGLAAHTSLKQARERALRELVERDAVMWTWVQRVSRERIDPGSLPDDVARLAREVGDRVDFVNLSLDVAPVVLCAVHDESSLHLGASCRADPREAAAKALAEATMMREAAQRQPAAALAERDVERPNEHHRLYRSPERVAQASFLFSSPDRIALADIAAPFREPFEERLRAAGEPLVVNLSSRSTRPFHVVRALLPGLVPISFGWDREPLGMPRLLQPLRTADGRRLGGPIGELAPLAPHPFP